MKQEELEMAASICAVKTSGRNEGKKNAAVKARAMYYCKECFKAGAEWQRNHVWHKRTEQPKDGSLVLVMRGDVGLIAGPNHDDWEDIVKELNLETWAYLSDLTPTSFDDILEANKDVLQRLKKGETKWNQR